MRPMLFATLVALAFAAGCSTQQATGALESPIVIAGVATMTSSQCAAFAHNNPLDAAVTLRVLYGIEPSLAACRAALESVLVPRAPEP